MKLRITVTTGDGVVLDSLDLYAEGRERYDSHSDQAKTEELQNKAQHRVSDYLRNAMLFRDGFEVVEDEEGL